MELRRAKRPERRVVVRGDEGEETSEDVAELWGDLVQPASEPALESTGEPRLFGGGAVEAADIAALVGENDVDADPTEARNLLSLIDSKEEKRGEVGKGDVKDLLLIAEDDATIMPGGGGGGGGGGAQTLAVWGVGLFAAHIVSGYMQEMLFAIKGYTFGFYLTLTRYVVNALLAFIYLRLVSNDSGNASGAFRYLLRHYRSWLVSLPGGAHAARWRWWWEDRKEKSDDDDDANATGDDGPPSREMGHTRSLHNGDGDDLVAAEGDDGEVSNNSNLNGRFLSQSKGSIILEMGGGAAAVGGGGTAPASHSIGAVGQKVPLRYYLLLSFLSVMALGLGTSALAFLNYPTKVILKTSKLVVIMMFSRIILGKKHSSGEYSMALSMVAGLVLFTLGDYYVKMDPSSAILDVPLESDIATTDDSVAEVDPMEESFEWRTAKGVLLLFLSLIFEAINVNMQKKILVGYERSSPAELVFYNAFFGSLVTFAIVLANGELFEAWEFSTTHPDCHFYVFGFALFSTCGVACAIMVLHYFDPMTIGILVTGRKSITVLTSFILIPKPVSIHHLSGGLLVFASLFMSAWWKSLEGISKPKDFAMD